MVAEESQPGLRVSHDLAGPAVVITVAGEIDLATVTALRTELGTALRLAAAPAPVVLDLTGVEFLGSAGLAAIAEASQQATAQRIPLRVVATSHTVLRPIEVTGLGSALTLCASLSDALGATGTSDGGNGSQAAC